MTKDAERIDLHSKTDDEPLSVNDAVTLAKITVGTMPVLNVVGEVSSFKGPNAQSGHCYFDVKDDQSSMPCIVWRGVYEKSGIELRDGLEIQMRGSFEVYAPTSRLSFIARKIEISGEGALRAQVAALAKRLEAEGLMDPARKRAVPRFCNKVAVVTSLSGSVLDDVKRTLARRNPLVELVVAGCAVQGSHAAPTIIRALNTAAQAQPDCILLVRGGGSYEDLMCFNDEALARAVVGCPVPVVTGIGHEPDTCICDMVADKRLSTPTAAAESVAPALDEIVAQKNERAARLGRATQTQLASARQQLESSRTRLPAALSAGVQKERSWLNAFSSRRVLSDPTSLLSDHAAALELTAQRLLDAFPRSYRQHQQRKDVLERSFFNSAASLFSRYRAPLERAEASLEALSPLRVLERGYAIVQDTQGHVVSDAATVQVDDEIIVRLARGEIRARTLATTEADPDDTSENKS